MPEHPPARTHKRARPFDPVMTITIAKGLSSATVSLFNSSAVAETDLPNLLTPNDSTPMTCEPQSETIALPAAITAAS